MFVSSLIAASAIAYAVGVARLWRHAGAGRGVRPWQAAAFAAGWLALVAALASPLDELAETLFAAHMAQHELLMVVAAPLIALSSPLVAYLWVLPHRGRRLAMTATRGRAIALGWTALTAAPTVWMLHGLALWIWHMPSLYDAAVQHEAVHAAQHLSFFGSAALFWWGMAHGRYGRGGYGAAVLYIFATAVHSGVLGALLTFSPHVWYPLYDRAGTTAGLTPLEDQQLAGLLMWVPASVIFIAGGLYFFAAWLQESGRRVRVIAASAPRGVAARGTPLMVCLAVVAGIGFSACGGDPNVQFARTVDQAASWAASVQFAAEKSRAGEVPHAYVHDLLATASKNLDDIAQDLEKSRDVDAGTRAGAAAACRELAARVRDADRADRLPDARELSAVKARLRQSAQTARAAARTRQAS